METDPNTGKTIDWEPVEQAAFATFHAEALADRCGVLDEPPNGEPQAGVTYELVGPRFGTFLGKISISASRSCWRGSAGRL